MTCLKLTAQQDTSSASSITDTTKVSYDTSSQQLTLYPASIVKAAAMIKGQKQKIKDYETRSVLQTELDSVRIQRLIQAHEHIDTKDQMILTLLDKNDRLKSIMTVKDERYEKVAAINIDTQSKLNKALEQQKRTPKIGFWKGLKRGLGWLAAGVIGGFVLAK